MSDAEKLKKHLASLGTTVGGVVAKLKAAKISGRRVHYDSCPLAVWLTKKMKNPVTVTEDDCQVTDGDIVKLPRPCKLFVRNFDAGKYPLLEIS